MMEINVVDHYIPVGNVGEVARPDEITLFQSYRGLDKAKQKLLQNGLKVFGNVTGWAGIVELAQIAKAVRYSLRLSDYFQYGPPSLAVDCSTRVQPHVAVKQLACTTMGLTKFIATPLKLLKTLQNLDWIHENALAYMPAGWRQACTTLTKVNITLLLVISGLDLVDLYRSGRRDRLTAVRKAAYVTGSVLFLSGSISVASGLLTAGLVLEMASAWQTAFPTKTQKELQFRFN